MEPRRREEKRQRQNESEGASGLSQRTIVKLKFEGQNKEPYIEKRLALFPAGKAQ